MFDFFKYLVLKKNLRKKETIKVHKENEKSGGGGGYRYKTYLVVTNLILITACFNPSSASFLVISEISKIRKLFS